MSAQYAREILRRNVASVCLTVGWNCVHSTPLDMLVHILEKYIMTLGLQAKRYAEQFNRTEPNIQDLGLVFHDLQIKLVEIAEYISCIPSEPSSIDVRFPKPVETSLSFLKAGSYEDATRPMHIQKHFPPIPGIEQDTPSGAVTVEIPSIDSKLMKDILLAGDSNDIFKKPYNYHQKLKKSVRLRRKSRILDTEDKVREIRSVIMTTEGFVIPAREGKEAVRNFITSVNPLRNNK